MIRAALLFLFAVPAQAQEVERFRDWTITRDGDACVASVDVGLRAPSSGLASVAILPRTGGGEVPAVMTLRVPVGAVLSEPPAYVHPGDAKAVGLAWQSCDALSCMASGGIALAELERLRAGTRIVVGFRPLTGVRPLLVPISLLGLTAALAACK